MRIAAIGDTHGREGWIIPNCDVFVHTGDFTAGGSASETMRFIVGMERRIGHGGIKHVLLVPGNHDRTCYECLDLVKANATDPRFHWLVDEGVTIEGKTFWGSPWTPPFNDWWYMAEETRLAAIYKLMPETLDVLITHGPPRGVLDPGHQGDHVGSIALMDAIAQRNIQHHVFGHLHAAGGLTKHVAFLDTKWGNIATQFHNVAAVDESYEMRRPAFEFEI